MELGWREKFKFIQLQQAASKMRRHKAPGEDGLPVDIYKDCPSLFRKLKYVWNLDNKNWNKQMGIVTLLHKKGSREDMSNYRPITLLNTDHKLIAKVLSVPLGEIAQKRIGRFQHGFIKHRSIAEAIIKIRATKAWNRLRHHGYILFVDFAKAYDTLFRDLIWEVFEKKGCPQALWQQLITLYDKGTMVMYINGVLGHSFELERGVKQGCPLSPVLFVFVTVVLEEMALKVMPNRQQHMVQWLLVMFADDLTIQADSDVELQDWAALLDRWKLVSRLQVAYQKTACWTEQAEEMF